MKIKLQKMSLHSRAISKLPGLGVRCAIAARWMAMESCKKKNPTEVLKVPPAVSLSRTQCFCRAQLPAVPVRRGGG